jgi:hypothetical protein
MTAPAKKESMMRHVECAKETVGHQPEAVAAPFVKERMVTILRAPSGWQFINLR